MVFHRSIFRAIGCLAIVVLSGCSLEQYCDERLQLEWGQLTAGRFDKDENPIKPTADEANALRTLIRRCKKVRPEFDLVDTLNLVDGEVWGRSNILLLAIQLDDTALLDQLVSDGYSNDGLPNSFGISTLYVATYRRAANAFEWALAKGVDPNLTDTEGIGPLTLAAAQPQDEFQSIQALVSAGAEIDNVSSEGWNPLAVAIRTEKFDNALLLVEAGADVALARSLLVEKARTVPSDNANKEILAALDTFEKLLE